VQPPPVSTASGLRPRGNAEIIGASPLVVTESFHGDASGRQMALAVHARVTAVALAFGKRLCAEPRTQFAIVRWPRTLAAGGIQAMATRTLSCAR